jgi:signal transduction histidine kinase
VQTGKIDDRLVPDFRALFEAYPARQLVLAPGDLTIIAVSDAFLFATKTVKEEVIGLGLFALFSDEDSPASDTVRALRASFERVLATRARDVVPAQPYDIRRRRAADAIGVAAPEWVAVNSPVTDENGVVAFIIHVLEDVTDSRSIQDQLAVAVAARDEALRTSQLKTRFLGMISHELRTPLTALSLQVERMQRNAVDLNHRHHESLDRIAFSAGRMREMIETLLEYARIDGGHVAVNAARFDLADSVRNTVVNHRHEAEQRGLELRFWLRIAPAMVCSDRRLVELVISNLVDNAIKFTQVGAINVVLDRSEDGAHRVAVTDTGAGIPEALQKKIFEPFEQLSSGRQASSGIGLGLALVRDIAGALGGRIEIASQPSKGSTFTFVLPAAATADGARPAPDPGKG